MKEYKEHKEYKVVEKIVEGFYNKYREVAPQVFAREDLPGKHLELKGDAHEIVYFMAILGSYKNDFDCLVRKMEGDGENVKITIESPEDLSQYSALQIISRCKVSLSYVETPIGVFCTELVMAPIKE